MPGRTAPIWIERLPSRRVTECQRDHETARWQKRQEVSARRCEGRGYRGGRRWRYGHNVVVVEKIIDGEPDLTPSEE